MGATVSETQVFFTKPMKKRVSAPRTSTLAQTRFSKTCGRKVIARTIGPATSCGKKEMKKARSRKLRTGASRRR